MQQDATTLKDIDPETSVIANTNFFTSDFSSRSEVSAIRIVIAVDIGGVFKLIVDKQSVGSAFNSNAALAANTLYQFSFQARKKYAYNFQLSVTAKLKYFTVDEIAGTV